MTCRTGKGLCVARGDEVLLYLNAASVLVEVVEGVVQQGGVFLRAVYIKFTADIAVLVLEGVGACLGEVAEVKDMYAVVGVPVLAEGLALALVYHLARLVLQSEVNGLL